MVNITIIFITFFIVEPIIIYKFRFYIFRIIIFKHCFYSYRFKYMSYRINKLIMLNDTKICIIWEY